MFFSWSQRDHEAWGIDSLAQDVNWAQFQLPYCFPPFPLLLQVLEKCRSQEVPKMILVAPWWTGKPFFPVLLDMLLDCQRIPISSQMIVDLATGFPPPDLQRLKLVACLISGKSDQTQATSQNRPKNWLKPHGEGRRKRDMEEHGGSGVNGAVCREYRQLRPL